MVDQRTEQQWRPRVAMLVANDISRDSRVQKAAYSVAEAGYEVLLVGYDPAAGARAPGVFTRIGAARVVRTGLSNRHRLRAAHLRSRELPRATGLRRVLLQVRIAVLRAASLAVTYDYKVRRRLMKSVMEPGTGGPGWKSRAKEILWKVYIRDGDWRRTARHLLLLEDAWSQVVEDFAPDLVHAHDMHTPGIAVRIADRIARKPGGRRPKVVYDAHEFVAGVAMPTQRKLAYEGLEREFVRRADAVVTVSAQLADLLRERYGLAQLPTVVANAPMPEPVEDLDTGPDSGAADAGDADLGDPGDPGDAPSLRRACGLGDGVPLLVYSGAVSPARGVDTVIEGLAYLPGVHAAIVCGERNATVRELVATAQRLGVDDRVHVVPYVAPHQVPAFLSSATAGVIPILHTPNHEIALITKFYEYMHARLPILVSDVRAMAEATIELGCGEVFRAGQVESFVAAARAVLADPGRYASRYTDRMLAENSWPGQAEVLCALYARLLGTTPRPLPGRRPFAEAGR